MYKNCYVVKKPDVWNVYNVHLWTDEGYTVEEAEETVKVRAEEKGHPCHYEQVGDRYVVYRSSDNKVMKSINYFAPNLKQFFTDEELRQTTRS